MKSQAKSEISNPSEKSIQSNDPRAKKRGKRDMKGNYRVPFS
jgi:hypothetical protein